MVAWNRFIMRNFTINPGTGHATVRQPFIPGGNKGAIMRHGIKGEQPSGTT
jgi:hypothetical protein